MELNHRGEPQETEQRIRSLDTGRPSSGLMPVSKLGQDSETILYPTSNLQPCLFLSLKKKKREHSKARRDTVASDETGTHDATSPALAGGGGAKLSFHSRKEGCSAPPLCSQDTTISAAGSCYPDLMFLNV